MPPGIQARMVHVMSPITLAALLPLWAVAGSLPAPAQAQTPAAASTRPEPTDPKAQVPPALVVSPLRAYPVFVEPQVAPWRETNDLVRQRGGWRAYAREAREPDAPKSIAPPASQPASAAKPAASGHVGHEMK